MIFSRSMAKSRGPAFFVGRAILVDSGGVGRKTVGACYRNTERY